MWAWFSRTRLKGIRVDCKLRQLWKVVAFCRSISDGYFAHDYYCLVIVYVVSSHPLNAEECWLGGGRTTRLWADLPLGDRHRRHRRKIPAGVARPKEKFCLKLWYGVCSREWELQYCVTRMGLSCVYLCIVNIVSGGMSGERKLS